MSDREERDSSLSRQEREALLNVLGRMIEVNLAFAREHNRALKAIAELATGHSTEAMDLLIANAEKDDIHGKTTAAIEVFRELIAIWHPDG